MRNVNEAVALFMEGCACSQAILKEFTAEFERRNRTLICRDLLECDIRTAEGIQAAKERNLFKTICPNLRKG